LLLQLSNTPPLHNKFNTLPLHSKFNTLQLNMLLQLSNTLPLHNKFNTLNTLNMPPLQLSNTLLPHKFNTPLPLQLPSARAMPPQP
jgi:hypothetical protein